MVKMIKTGVLAVSLSLSVVSLACSQNGKDGFVPENNLNLPVGHKSINTISEDQFNALIDKVEAIYAPIVASKGAKLEISRKWTDGTVNAYASQSGKTWQIAMFGGLARHKTITEDGMSLVVCHELGHHLGGAPKKGGSAGGGWWGGGSSATSWASNEGQSDYFATLKCLRKAFLNDDNARIVAALKAPETLISACKLNYASDAAETNLCIRMGMAGKSVSDLFSDLARSGETKFDSPDAKVVSSTNDSHPAAQCRLDTYFQGALCDISFNEDVSDTDEVKGTCHPSLGSKIGTRPLCWFKPTKL